MWLPRHWALPCFGRRGLDVGEHHGDDAEQWQPCADLEYVVDARHVGKPAEECRPYASKPEHQPEEDACHHSHLVGFQVGGIHYYRRECRRDNQADDSSYHDNPWEAADVGQRQRERCRPENREQYHIFAPISVAKETAEQCSGCECCQIGEQAELRLLYGQAEFVNQEEGKIVRHAGIVEVF